MIIIKVISSCNFTPKKKGRKNLTGDFLLGNEIHGTNKQHGHWYP